jgi:hypothetical protein
MAGLDPAIHAFLLLLDLKSWMPGAVGYGFLRSQERHRSPN